MLNTTAALSVAAPAPTQPKAPPAPTQPMTSLSRAGGLSEPLGKPTRDSGVVQTPAPVPERHSPEQQVHAEARPSSEADEQSNTSDELMRQAQHAYVSGDRSKATELALKVAKGGGPDAERAWRFVGSAACSVRNAPMSNTAYDQLANPEHKEMLKELCQRNGLGFANGRFLSTASTAE